MVSSATASSAPVRLSSSTCSRRRALKAAMVQRETIYTAEPFPAPDWRRPWAEDAAASDAPGDLPARIRGGDVELTDDVQH